jgi:YD repeat-containing protein
MPETRDRHGNRIFGAVVGVVTNNQDPDNRARVKVRYPWLDGTLESDWARVATFYAGAGRGSYFMPEVGDEVLLMFHGGDPEKPYVFGSVWNGKDNVPGPGNPDGKNDDKWFESRSGHQLKFNDGASPKITLIDSSKNNSFVIDTSADTITQQAATGDIFWSAPAGSINLKCVDLNVSVTGSATHTTDTTESWTVGNNQTVTIETSQTTTVGASSTQKTPDAKISYSSADLTAGVAAWTVAELKSKIKAVTLTQGTVTKIIGSETAGILKYGLLAQAITHNGVSVVESGNTELGIGGATLAWTGGEIALKGGFVGILGTGMVNVLGGLVGLNPKVMCFPVAKLLDPIMSPFCEFHNVVPYTAPLPPVLPMIPHFSIGPIINGIAVSVLVNGRPAAGVGADAIGFHIPLVGVTEIPTPPRCVGRILNTIFLTTLSAAMAAYGLHSVVTNSEITVANKVSAIVQTIIGLALKFIPLPIMTGSIVLGAPSVAVNGQPPGLLLTPMGAATCSEIPIIPNALSLGFSNVIAGLDFGELAKQLIKHFVMGAIMFGIKKASGRLFGHPVDAVHGHMFTEDADVRLPGPLPLELRRHYSSLAARGIAVGQGVYAEAPASTVGPGWRHTFEEWIHDDGETLRLHTYDGFVKRPLRPGSAEGARAFDAAEELDLTREDGGGLRVRDKAGRTRRFVPRRAGDPWMRLVAVGDEWGNAVALEHDHHGRPARLRDSAGRVLRFVYGEDGLLEQLRLVHAPDRAEIDVHLASYVHDSRGDLREARDRTLVAKRFDYDDGHLLVREADRNGYAFHFEYDGQGRCVRTHGDDGAFHGEIEFVGEGFTRVTDGYGNVTLYRADEQGRLLAEVGPSGRTARWEYDSAGRAVLEERPDGAVWKWEHDARGNRLSTTRPDGTRATFAYDAADRPLSITAPDDSVWRAAYDDGGRVETYVSPTGAVRRLERDARGLVVRATSPTGAVERRRHDAYGNVVQLERAGAGTWRLEYDELGQVTAVTTARGRWQYAWDAGGRLARMDRPDGTAARWEYDAEGNVVHARDGDRVDNRWTWDSMRRVREHVDGGGFVTRYEHGLYRDLRRVVLPDGAEIRFEHDADLNIVRMQTPDGRDERYAVDAEGRPVGIVEPGGGERRLDYDALGRLLRVRLADGTVRRYEYTALGQVAAVLVERPGDMAGGPHEEARYQYDGEGRMVTELVGGERRRYEYDAAGRRTRLASSDGLDLRWKRDVAGGLVALTLPDGSRQRFTRHDDGRLASWELPSGLVEDYAYDPVGRLAGQALHRATTGGGGGGGRGGAPAAAGAPVSLRRRRTACRAVRQSARTRPLRLRRRTAHRLRGPRERRRRALGLRPGRQRGRRAGRRGRLRGAAATGVDRGGARAPRHSGSGRGAGRRPPGRRRPRGRRRADAHVRRARAARATAPAERPGAPLRVRRGRTSPARRAPRGRHHRHGVRRLRATRGADARGRAHRVRLGRAGPALGAHRRRGRQDLVRHRRRRIGAARQGRPRRYVQLPPRPPRHAARAARRRRRGGVGGGTPRRVRADARARRRAYDHAAPPARPVRGRGDGAPLQPLPLVRPRQRALPDA